MDPQKLVELLQSAESDVLDFKLEVHDLGAKGDSLKQCERKRAKFAKDLLAFANIWRDQVRHIVYGAKPSPSGHMDAPGIVAHPDSADLVAALEGLVHPCPRFHYMQVQLNGLQYGVIEISADRSVGPFFAVKDVSGGEEWGNGQLLRKNALYCRRDSANVEASPGEQSAIWKWFQGDPSLLPSFPSEGAWSHVVEAGRLDDLQCRHILILALERSAVDARLAHLADMDWTLVIDLDPSSDMEGALRHFRDRLAGRRALHLVAPDGNMLGNPQRSTYWLFARGQQVAQNPVARLAYKEWVARYAKAASAKIEQLAAACPGPVSVVALCEALDTVAIVRKLVEDIAANFGDRVTSVALAAAEQDWKPLASDGITSLVAMDCQHFLDGLAARTKRVTLGAENVVQLPGYKGVPKDVSMVDVTYLEEDLELVHLSAGTRPEEGVEPLRHFLRGAQISWFDLGLQSDVERDATRGIQRQVESDLEQRRTSRVNLYHEPGAGGTTIARRILWGVHQRYPSVVLRRCSPRESAERIALIYERTGQPILILREGGDVPEADAEQLWNFLASTSPRLRHSFVWWTMLEAIAMRVSRSLTPASILSCGSRLKK